LLERSHQGVPVSLPAPPGNFHILMFLALAGLVLWFTRGGMLIEGWQEDLPVYTHALQQWRAGVSPYDASLAPLFFLYPPAFLYIAAGLSHLTPAGWGGTAYLVAHLSAICALPLVLARSLFRLPWLSPLFALLLFFSSSRFTGVLALCGLNVASLLYCLGFVCAIPGLRRNRWEWFYVAVFFAAIIKITFLALLLLPLLAGRRQWLRSVACGAAVVGTNFAESAFWPELYDGYEWSLRQGILMQEGFGYGIFGALATYHYKERGGAGVAPYIASVLVAAGLMVLMFLLRRRMARLKGFSQARSLAENGNWLALIVVAIVLVNPRQMQYDVDIALLAGFVLWVYGLRTRRLLALAAMLFLPSLVVPYLVLNPHMHGLYEVLLVLAAFGLGYWRLWRDTGSGVMPGLPFLIKGKVEEASVI
jgi:hypothetical protein